jgi:tripartite-type tricarboxylate transporter receptor subunit TctC
MQRRTLLRAAGAIAIAPHLNAHAQAYPQRPITVYCAFPAGGPTDVVFRAFADAAGRELRQSVVVENKPGAGGTIAPLALKSARPDGYLLSQAAISVFRIPQMQKAPQLDPLRDLTWIANLTGYTFGIVVPAGSPWKTFGDYIEDARRNPGQINYGSTGTGTSPHLAMEEVAANAGVKFNHIPFKGSADLMTALLGGHVMAASDSTGWAPHVESGKVRLLATFGSKRTRKWPDVPTLEELGYKTVSDSPFGIVGPAGMEPAVVGALNDALRKSLDDPRVKELLERYDQPVIYMGPTEYSEWARRTWDTERGTIERLGLKNTL